MNDPVVIDMTPDGEFTGPPPPTLFARALQVVVAVAVLAGVLFIVAVALWFAILLIPIAIGVALVGWFTLSARKRS